MGALAPEFSFTPEDDILLRDAIEGGASLEALAKGAVHFSRRFTIQELRDRWYYLLYDQDVALDTSVHMVKLGESSSRQSNFNRSGKRKTDSIRKCFDAMRRRIGNEPFESNNKVALGNNNVPGNGKEHIPNHFRVEVSNFNMMDHGFPDVGCGPTSVGLTSHTCRIGLRNCVEDHIVDQNKIPRTIEENLCPAGNYSLVEELGQSREVCNLFEADEKPTIMFDQMNVNQASMGSELRDCSAPYHNFGYSSQLPQMPIWSAIEGVSAPTLPGVHLDVEEHHMGETFALSDDDDKDYTSDAEIQNQMSCNNAKNSGSSADQFFADLSNSLFNFTNEEDILCRDADGQDTIDKSYIEGLSSLLLNSPGRDDPPKPNVTVPEAAVLPDQCLNDEGPFGQICNISSSEVQIPSKSAVNHEFPEKRNWVICCVLNTEDPEIPCNDDVFLLSHLPSSAYGTQWKPLDISGSQKPNDGGPSLMKRVRDKYEQSHFSSQMVGPKTGLNLPIGDRGVKFDLPNSDIQQGSFRNSSIACGGPRQNHSENATTKNPLPVTVKEEVTQIEQAAHCGYNSVDFYKEESHGFNSLASCSKKNDSCSNEKIDAAAAVQENDAVHAGVASTELTVPEPVEKPSKSDEDEFLIGSDGDDIPTFSDVEAMILDMDLSPDDQDLYSSMDVSSYQNEDSKREIIRLEQAADAFVQRAMASKGALAVLFGCHFRSYIKKPEVLLGRATEDVSVDIDLGRGGHASKISRRQAIIKIEKDGSFHMKNLGNRSIFVNSKEVVPKQIVTLTSRCLIDIRGIPFSFETNKSGVKKYVDGITKGSQT